MSKLPKNYVVLGHIKDINVPSSWANYDGYKDCITGYAWRFNTPNDYDDGRWHEVEYEGWCSKSSDITIAALPGSKLYNMNRPKKRARPTVKEVEELNNIILNLKAENGKLREQLAAISKVING